MGAEVVKVEMPPLGDVTRSLNPFGWFYKEQSPMFMHINPSKLYMGLDLHQEPARISSKSCAPSPTSWSSISDRRSRRDGT